MKEYKLRYVGDPLLRTKCKAFNFKKDKLLLSESFGFMKEEMDKQNGLGISAPQIGVNKKVIVLNLKLLGIYEELQDEQGHLIMINPKYNEVSEIINKDLEGCLSLPNVYLPVKRHKEIEIYFKDLKGKRRKLKFKDLAARCIQHECDHIGVYPDEINSTPTLFIDRVEQRDLIEKSLGRNSSSSLTK